MHIVWTHVDADQQHRIEQYYNPSCNAALVHTFMHCRVCFPVQARRTAYLRQRARTAARTQLKRHAARAMSRLLPSAWLGARCGVQLVCASSSLCCQVDGTAHGPFKPAGQAPDLTSVPSGPSSFTGCRQERTDLNGFDFLSPPQCPPAAGVVCSGLCEPWAQLGAARGVGHPQGARGGRRGRGRPGLGPPPRAGACVVPCACASH